MGKKRTRVYKPEILKQDKIDGGLKKAFSGLKDKKQSEKQSDKTSKKQDDKPFSWNPQPMNIPKSNQKQGQINIPNYWAPKKKDDEKEEEEPYWSAEEWEAWALELFDNYPDYRKVLPEWFVEAADSE